MKISNAGVELIKSFESLSLEAYKCPRGKLTIGWGHTGLDVFEGQKINPQQAEELLRADIGKAEDAVNRLVCTPLPEHQFSALVSLCFNIGAAALSKSHLLRLVNQSDPILAADQFLKWVHVNGTVMPGLVKRRAYERKMFLGLT